MIPIDELNLALASVNLGLLGVAVAKVHLLHGDIKQTRDSVYVAERAAEVTRVHMERMEKLQHEKAAAAARAESAPQRSAEDMAKDLVAALQRQQGHKAPRRPGESLVGKRVTATGTSDEGSRVTVSGMLTSVTYRVYARAYNGSVPRSGQDAIVGGVELTRVSSLEEAP